MGEMNSQSDNEYLERYKRHILIKNIGGTGQKKLREAKVLLIGLGGIGSTVLQHLAGAGIGKIGLVDKDVVSLSNLQRQTIYTFKDIGRKKVNVASNFILKLNKNVHVAKYNFFLNSSASTNIISEYDIILDGTDNVEARELINQECLDRRKPLIFGGVSGWEGIVSLFIHENSACFKCTFGDDTNNGNVVDCSAEGVLGVTTSLVGTLMVAETIKLICGVGELLTNKLLICDTLTGVTEILHIKKNKKCIACRKYK